MIEILVYLYILISTFLFGVFTKWMAEEGKLDTDNSIRDNAEYSLIAFCLSFTHPIWITCIILFLLGSYCVYVLTKRTTNKFKDLPGVARNEWKFDFEHWSNKEFDALLRTLSLRELKDINICSIWTIIHISEPQKDILGKRIYDLSFEKEVLE